MASRLDLSQTQEITLRGSRVQYRVAGQGRPILYLGTPASSTLDSLAKHFHVYIPALPAVSASPRDLAELAGEFAAAAIGERCDVIGCSSSAAAATWLAILHPDWVGQLVLESQSGFQDQPGGIVARLPEVQSLTLILLGTEDP